MHWRKHITYAAYSLSEGIAAILFMAAAFFLTCAWPEIMKVING